MPDSQARPSRRGFVLGTAAAGVAAAAVVAIPKPQAPVEVATSEPLPAPERGGGYRESEHVQRYYSTTRI